MKLRGDQLKKFRKSKGLSQKQLAQGICTQATISLIEKNNKIPGMTILSQLCARLGISIDEILVDDNQVLTDIFTEINDLMLQKKYDAATILLNNVGIKQLQGQYDKERYYYFLGMLQLDQSKDYDEALFNFELVLKQFAVDNDDIYQVMTTIATGTAWFYKGDYEQAKLFAKKGAQSLQIVNTTASVQQMIAANVSLAQLNQQIEQPATAIELAQQALLLCRKQNVLFLLDDVYAILASSYFTMGQLDDAKENSQIAISLTKVMQHAELRERLIKQFRKLGGR
ncbi:helix-turn-helix domain-containing protein [Paucilactobacillus kaifaensis]|uniref:helix-turn-helix domain-containing protein n=1 Tax=Paucilactobacillus kaifaensis TaxID=2559921 RepID=UPI001485B384|nr:helix-turn-helix transcriptional regulator [Paucilactobacillus kaifaensis]